MKHTLLFVTLSPVFLMALGGYSSQGQESTPPTAANAGGGHAGAAARPRPSAPRINLNFPGGTPQQLADLISKQLGKPLNVIIPEEHEKMTLPALKMADVTVAELFTALNAATKRSVPYVTSWNHSPSGKIPQYNLSQSSYGFKTLNETVENPVWYFYYDKPIGFPEPETTPPQPACRFWNLGPYLETFKVEDITTAVETGWKMQGVTPLPKLSFHKDTKLLIGVGQQGQLEMIDYVLRQLEPLPKNPLLGQPTRAN